MNHTSKPAFARIAIHACALLIAAFFSSLSTAAETTEPVVRISDNWAMSAPASSGQLVTEPASAIDKAPPQVRPKLAASTLKDIETSPSRAWKDNMVVRENEEAYNCLLSFGIGGELKAGGYAGTRVLGRTLTLNSGRSK